MTNPALSSLLFPTILLGIGLFFFIRSSVKERTEQLTLQSEETAAALAAQLREYFTSRAYRIAEVEPSRDRVTFEGNVQPSWFLAIFLTILTAIGLLCVVPIVSILAPQIAGVSAGIVLLSPLAGAFYWKQAGRTEQVSLRVETLSETDATTRSQVTVRGHRDELIALQQAIPLRLVSATDS
ncbi:MAG TPA: cofactor assembly of complex C subunit B [Oscillatoriales cyanobacterium M59_W2019_021]|nr:cofactor assembly of complex C subunit B [Oscillatoriales cyanobacterium M4454_W2019_049]HIK51160.1 cofactor assembly of complex C subunit B [Oscillatoriales cyanobacterium M59_W2019_021]